MKKVLAIFLLFLFLFSASYNFVYATEESGEIVYGTDFTNANYKVESDSKTTYSLVISGIKYDSDLSKIGSLKFMVTDTNQEPDFEDNNEYVTTHVDKGEAIISSFEKYLELKQDIYLWVFEIPYKDNTKTKLMYSSKIEKPELKKYTDIYYSTMVTYNDVQILMNAPWHSDTERNIKIKIGEIKDDSILLSIKNKESNCFEKLLEYGKKGTNSIFDQTVKSTKGLSGYKTESPVSLYDKLTDKKYYYLYTYVDDGDGKYLPIEGITLAQASKYTDSDKSWFMFFYGDDNFNWKDFNTQSTNQSAQKTNQTTPTDNTITRERIPDAGANKIVVSLIIILTITSVAILSELKKYKGID